MRLNSGAFIVDAETGETVYVPQGTYVRTPVEVAQIRKSYSKKAKLKNDSVPEMCGEFFWASREIGQPYCCEVSDRLLSKIMYLFTYMDYESKLAVGDSVQSILELSRNRTYEFWRELSRAGYVTNREGEYVVCDKFSRGSLNKEQAAVKMFTHGIRSLYKETAPRRRVYISHLIRLIPYASMKYNVVAENPLERKWDKLKPMSAKRICEAVGYSESNARKLLNGLSELRFTDRVGVRRKAVTMQGRTLIINPQIYCGYMEQDELKKMIELCAETS